MVIRILENLMDTLMGRGFFGCVTPYYQFQTIHLRLRYRQRVGVNFSQSFCDVMALDENTKKK